MSNDRVIEDPVRAAFAFQAEVCSPMGSPFTAQLCRTIGDNIDHETAVGAFCLDWDGDPSPSADSVPLRICGGLHALVLSGRDEDLKQYYPPNSENPPPWPVIETALRNNEAYLLEWMRSPPQTNEVSRSAVLWPSMMALSSIVNMPLRILEVGASAGLNLQFDRFGYRLNGIVSGERGSPLQLQPEWRGADAAVHPVSVKRRSACDLNPLDPTDPQDALRLRAYVWPDQSERHQRLNAAIDIATENPAIVEQQDAVAWLQKELANLVAGECTVIYSTIAWQYLPEKARTAGTQIIEDAAGNAAADCPLAWLRFEADGESPGGGVRLQVWPDNLEASLGRADFHARWIDWSGL